MIGWTPRMAIDHLSICCNIMAHNVYDEAMPPEIEALTQEVNAALLKLLTAVQMLADEASQP